MKNAFPVLKIVLVLIILFGGLIISKKMEPTVLKSKARRDVAVDSCPTYDSVNYGNISK